jgi:RNA recognition motif-containing protein
MMYRSGKMKLYVGNLNFETTEEQLKEAFETIGKVQSVSIIRDRYTNRSKGFGFLEMPNDEEARIAIEKMNGQELFGRRINVAEARPPRENRNRKRFNPRRKE